MAKKSLLVIAGLPSLGLMSASVCAAVPTEVTTALAEAKEDAIAVAGLALVIIVAIAAFKYMRSAVR